MLFATTIDDRIIFVVALLMGIPIQFYKVQIIANRRFPDVTSLPYRTSIAEYVIFTLFVLTVLLLIIYYPKNNDYIFLFFLISPIINVIAYIKLKKTPHYIITDNKLIENDFTLSERKLDDLHSIEFFGIFNRIDVRFVNQYNISIRQGGYSKKELAEFIRKIIEASPVEAEVEPAVQSFVEKHTSTTVA